MTAREPSAVEVIAEATMAHPLPSEVLTFDREAWVICQCGKRIDLDVIDRKVSTQQVHERHSAHRAAAALAALKAAGFVVATRDEIGAMSVQQQAELIGGEVEWASGERGYGDCAEQWPDREHAEMDASSIRHHGLDGVLFERIAAGPWREVQP